MAIAFSSDNENTIMRCLGFAKYSRIACEFLRCLLQFRGKTAAYIDIGWYQNWEILWTVSDIGQKLISENPN